MAASDEVHEQDRSNLEIHARRREVRGNIPLLLLLVVMVGLVMAAAALSISGPYHSPRIASAPTTVPEKAIKPPRPVPSAPGSQTHG